MIYYHSNHFDKTNQKSTINYFLVSITIIYRRCKKLFVFNNKFYCHIREIDCFNFDIRLKKSFVFVIFDIEKSFIVTIYVIIVSFVNITKTLFESIVVDTNVILIIISNVDVFKNIEIDCDYRDWNYAKIEIVFFANVKLKFVCMNTYVSLAQVELRLYYGHNTASNSVTIRQAVGHNTASSRSQAGSTTGQKPSTYGIVSLEPPPVLVIRAILVMWRSCNRHSFGIGHWFGWFSVFDRFITRFYQVFC